MSTTDDPQTETDVPCMAVGYDTDPKRFTVPEAILEHIFDVATENYAVERAPSEGDEVGGGFRLDPVDVTPRWGDVRRVWLETLGGGYNLVFDGETTATATRKVHAATRRNPAAYETRDVALSWALEVPLVGVGEVPTLVVDIEEMA